MSLVLSLNEVQSLSAKAARGAGTPWGIAEDIGQAARWMAESGLDWGAPLLRLLDGGAPARSMLPVLHLADLLPGAEPGMAWTLEDIEPVWALALLGAALQGRAMTVDLVWEDGAARLGPDGRLAGEPPPASRPPRVAITVRNAGSATPGRPLLRRSRVSTHACDAIAAYASRTYVPATAASRTTGAGGGRVDDD